ncbi:hypothetical protein DL98DRAFT_593148 [Cadophora sp. DSE1049]|nr:hypothetical protein DL98DRAFT_593148 [Cadophora sp. DSE1049]
MSSTSSNKEATNTSKTAEVAKEEVSQENPDSSEALIQMAKSAGDGAVSIPGNMLASLLSNIKILQLQLGGFRVELSKVKGDLRALEAAAGMAFPRFKKLPLEIRRMIWRLALSMPRLVRVEEARRKVKHKGKDKEIYAYTPFEGYNPIRYTYRESRAEAVSMQTRILIADGAPHIFINTDADTVWFRFTNDDDDQIWQSIEQLGYWDRLPGMWNLIPGREQTETPHVAISLKIWGKSARNQIYLLMNKLYMLGVEKIYVVVGQNATCNGKTYTGSDMNNMEYHFDKKVDLMNWSEVGQAEMQYVREFQQERADYRESMIADVWRLDDEDDTARVDHWEVEEIEFVEICNMSEVEKDTGSFVVKF